MTSETTWVGWRIDVNISYTFYNNFKPIFECVLLVEADLRKMFQDDANYMYFIALIDFKFKRPANYYSYDMRKANVFWS